MTTHPSISLAKRNPQMLAAALALNENRLHDAEPILKAHLKSDPFDVAAMRMLAELAGRIGRYHDAENLLRRAVELAPTFTIARSNLALVLYRQGRPEEAIAELDDLLSNDMEDMGAANLKAAASSRIGDFHEAIALYETVLKARPNQEKIWLSYGHVLKTVGRLNDSIQAYRHAIALRPGFGEVWWSLANLKTVRFSDADLDIMQDQLARENLVDEDRFHIDFALGKAFEDRGDWPASFAHYDAGNRLRRQSVDYDPAEQHAKAQAHIAALSAPDQPQTGGHIAPDPIFILGMPRAGSTLIEQILSCHSMVEGTQELPDIGMMAQRLASKKMGDTVPGYPAVVSMLSADDLARLGAEYIERTQINRKTDKPYFIDKMPNNWQHVGLIRAILPQAKIIDARRHPMDCCFSNFKQHFARGQGFSYAQEDVGQYYTDYVAVMQAFDRAYPAHVTRVIHEDLVADSEGQIRKLLDALGLPFEEACLRFWENDRAVQTPSAEQVRRPINNDGMDRWRHYADWLGPMQRTLGDVIIAYPDVPVNL